MYARLYGGQQWPCIRGGSGETGSRTLPFPVFSQYSLLISLPWGPFPSLPFRGVPSRWIVSKDHHCRRLFVYKISYSYVGSELCTLRLGTFSNGISQNVRLSMGTLQPSSSGTKLVSHPGTVICGITYLNTFSDSFSDRRLVGTAEDKPIT